MSIALTNTCDLKCAHCYAPKYAARLETHALKRWIRELDLGGALGVGFGGGEPTLHPDFASLCEFTAIETGLAVSFTTHAHHLTSNLLERLKSHVNFVRVSVDGVGATYEGIRGRPFPVLMEQIRLLKKHIRFGINFWVSDATISDLSAAAQYAEDWGAEELLLLPNRVMGSEVALSKSAKRKLEEWLDSHSSRLRLTISESAEGLLSPIAQIPGETSLRAHTHIDASGRLKASAFDAGGISIGTGGLMAAYRELLSVKSGGNP
jgi:MoaA/NifB/PqqE/SkfB family radical SAM enzyme